MGTNMKITVVILIVTCAIVLTGIVLFCLPYLPLVPNDANTAGTPRLTGGETLLSLHKRWTYLKDPTWDYNTGTHKAPRMTNKWYFYVNTLAKSYDKNECYVCSRIPYSSSQVTLYGKMMDKSRAMCYASMGGIGYQHKGLIINDTHPYSPGITKGTCARNFWINWKKTSEKLRPQRVVLDTKGANHPICYYQAIGEIPMGNTTNCDQIVVHGDGAPVDLSGVSNGTYWVQGGWWLCGDNAYPLLPKYWTGTCTPISVTDHTFFLEPGERPVTKNRHKRGAEQPLKPHDAVWGSDVPAEFKHWSDGNKAVLTLFPHIGVLKNILRLETMDYRLGLYINSSLKVDTLQNHEIDAIRTVVMENRMALDLITASSGGTCVLIGTTCCTYITDDVHSKNMTDAMDRLRELQKVMAKDHVTGQGWFNWLMEGGWQVLLLKVCMFLIAIMLIMCVFTACIFPLIRSMMRKMFSGMVGNYIALQQLDEDTPPDYDEECAKDDNEL